MAKPKVFVSSTYYDLRHIRGVLENFITQYGYDAILYEKGSIFFRHDQILEESCIAEVQGCDILILVIGGRYGSLSKIDEEQRLKDPDKFSNEIRSITRTEYEKAREREIPIFIFVEDGVLSEYRTFLQNQESKTIKYAHADDRRVYEMLHDIYVQRTNNFVKGFSTHEDILNWLREQWAGLFAESLKRKQSDARISSLEAQIAALSNVVTSLKSYSEEIVRIIDKSNATVTIEKVNRQFETQQKIDTFRRSPLVRHVLRATNLLEDPQAEEVLRKIFSTARTLEEFLERSKLPAREIELLTSIQAAKHDFLILKKEMDDTNVSKKRAATKSAKKTLGTRKKNSP